jgi:membrane protease YdiL (CAAX protease family)
MSGAPPSGSSWPDLPELPEGVERSPLPAGRDESRWAPWTAPVALVLALLLALMGAIVVAVFGAIAGADIDDPTPAVTIASTVLQDAAFVGAALLLAARAGRLLPAQFGFRPTPLWPAVGWTALTLVGFYVLSAAWVLVTGTDETSELPSELGVDQSTVAFVAVCVVVTVIAPITEEVLFRGYVFGALRNWHGPWLAAILTGLLFGGIHAGSTDAVFLVPLAILGALLCLLRMQTGSLLPCMVAHGINNAIAFSVAEAEWDAWQTLLLIAGANALILLASVPLLRRARRDAQRLI